MKTTVHRILALFTGSALLASTAGTLTGQAPGPPRVVAQPRPVVVAPSTGLPVPEVEFQGDVEAKRLAEVRWDSLPLTEAVRFLRQEFPTVNFVLPASLEPDGIIVQLELRSVGLRDILTAIQIATDGRVDYELRTPTLVALIGPPAPPFPPQPQGVARGTAGPLSKLEVLNLRDILRLKDPKPIEGVLDFVKTATADTIMMLRDEAGDSGSPPPAFGPPRLNYHGGSGVLVMVGHPDAIDIAMKIIRSVRMQPARPDDEAADVAKPKLAVPAKREPKPKVPDTPTPDRDSGPGKE